MPIQVGGAVYYSTKEVQQSIGVSRQTLWRWRKAKKIPPGQRHRTHKILFTADDLQAIEAYADQITSSLDLEQGERK